tara:strand:- start:542 stop:1174 length:633 start_codon:yes stop_codon:yes gene_type:complete
MTTTFIISEAKLRQFTDLNDSVDTELIKNAVREAQDISLQRIIGTKLYDSILAQIDAGGGAAPVWTDANYENLVLNYIQDYLLYAAYYEALEAIYIRPRNNGLLTPTGGENSIETDRTLFNVKRQNVLNKGEFYAERLSSYLAAEQALFPELNTANKAYEQWPDYGSQYRSPIVFGRNARVGAHFQQAREAGLRITDSKYSQYPWGSNIK